jgi:ubiquinone/menaquinone biosynthesis C-methylase UbiE
MFKNIRINKDRKRALVKFSLFSDYLSANQTILDVGTGSGQFAQLLQEKEFQIQAVDIVDKTNATLNTPRIYDGKKFPFESNSFEVGMLITVLHHCPKPEKVFEEVVRVSSKRIFILEDVYSNTLMKYLTWFADSIANFEFIGHPHTNKSETEWEALFKENKLTLIHKRKVKVLFIFTQVVYVLEKEDK